MKCVMNRGLYLRADGRLPCYCSSGETVTLDKLPEQDWSFDFWKNYYSKGAFFRIRVKMSEGLVPFPGVCDQCSYLDAEGEYQQGLDETELEWFHWEPSSLCMLDCEWCRKERRRYANSGQRRLLPMELFERVVDGFAHRNIRLKMGNICGVGEPTTNPEVWDQIALVHRRLGGDILLSTNGNGPFSDKIVPSGLTKLKIAIDALDQEIYQRYRKNGKLSRVIKFTENVAKAKHLHGSEFPIIIWQYILFNYNDSDEDLVRLQKMALDYGVNRLRIVYTRCNNYSARSPEDFPKTFPDIDFLPVSQYSQIGLLEVKTIKKRIHSLIKDNMFRQAMLETIKLVNRIYHRFALGVRYYTQLLDFTRKSRHLNHCGQLDLSQEEFQEYLYHAKDSFQMLEKLNRDMGYTEEAEAYRKFTL